MTKILLSKTEAADALSISVGTLDRKVASGEIPAPINLGGRVLFRHSDLLDWVAGLASGQVKIEQKKRGRPRLAV